MSKQKKNKYHKKGLLEWILVIESEEESQKLQATILKWFPWTEKIVDALSRHIEKHPKFYKLLGFREGI